DGTPLKYGDKIQLLNAYTEAGYLDVWSDKLASIYGPLLTKKDETDYPVFASKNPRGASSTWTVTALDGKTTGEVKEGAVIKLADGTPEHSDHFLEANGHVTAGKGPFADYKDSKLMVFTTDKEGFHAGSEQWQITLKK
ncbi:MAG: hypothetical protein H0V54_06065, partial [Chthoniobacterales bacterium]|nr:hypothetical protein [Chthoniobacterales bacterium]